MSRMMKRKKTKKKQTDNKRTIRKEEGQENATDKKCFLYYPFFAVLFSFS